MSKRSPRSPPKRRSLKRSYRMDPDTEKDEAASKKRKSPRSPSKRRSAEPSFHMDPDTEMDDAELYPNKPSTPKRRRHEDPEFSALFTDTDVDYSEYLSNLFDEKANRSPTSKLTRKLEFAGLDESALLKKPKLATSGRGVGLTPEELERKMANRKKVSRLSRPKK